MGTIWELCVTLIFTIIITLPEMVIPNLSRNSSFIEF